jgi:DNA-binding CsgD family transcriptional regulator
MAPSMKSLSNTDLRRVATLWRELADAPAAECDAALRHCLARLGVLLGACNATWVGVSRQPAPDPSDPLLGWRLRDVVHLHHQERRLPFAREFANRIDAGQNDPYAVAIMGAAGRTRSHLRRELVRDDVWRDCWTIREALAEERIGDRLAAAHALTGDCESHFVLDREHGGRPFQKRERDLLHFFLLGSLAFQRELLLSRGMAGASATFSPREREVLQLLLTDASEKEISRRLGIGYRTVHQHAASVYAKLGVRGRRGLVALWLRCRAGKPG